MWTRTMLLLGHAATVHRQWYSDCFKGCSQLSRSYSPSIKLPLLPDTYTNKLSIALVTGVVAEKGRLFPFLIFSFFWTSLVYDPIAYWLWNVQGWGNSMGGLDWAGGTPVHICSGAATLAYTVMLKYIRVTTDDTHSITSISHDAGSWKKYLFSRAQRRERLPSGPTALEAGLESHNMTNAMLGMLLVWFGWFGFNAGSELKANMRAVSTFIATHIAACSGGVAYTLLERMAGQKWSGLGFCTGAFAGLVAITPGAGYVRYTLL